MNVEDFYKKLNDAINSANVSQADIAAQLNISRNTVTNWKKKTGMPSAIEMYQIAKICKKPISWFFDEKGNENVDYLKEKILFLEETINTQKQLIQKLESLIK